MRPAELDQLLYRRLGDAEALLVPLYGAGRAAMHLRSDYAQSAGRAGAVRAQAIRAIDFQLRADE